MNVKSEVGKPTSLAMLELVTRLQMPFAIGEPIECFSKVLDGTPVACGLGIGRGSDVVFVSHTHTTMCGNFNF